LSLHYKIKGGASGITFFHITIAQPMKISKVEFVTSAASVSKCPAPDKPEFAFIGRSNVGKSSLINMLVQRKNLARISSTPGKTQLINHFVVNDEWYLVDLPGYGYAKISQSMRKSWETMIHDYMKHRENLVCVFVLLDSRHPLQTNDNDFMKWLGSKQIPFIRIFTKMDKDGVTRVQANIASHNREMKKTWAQVPPAFVSSAEKQIGREDILKYIDNLVHPVEGE
jgi:GTP-binding protein